MWCKGSSGKAGWDDTTGKEGFEAKLFFLKNYIDQKSNCKFVHAFYKKKFRSGWLRLGPSLWWWYMQEGEDPGGEVPDGGGHRDPPEGDQALPGQ